MIEDAENRLVAMETRPDVAAVLPALKQRLEFAYDAQGRRIQKKVSTWNLSLGTWNLERDTRFLYYGWNLLAELNASSLQPNATYVWGLDLSGELLGAGGVGGLLAVNVTAGSATHYPAYDGNGNIIALVSATDGSQSAEYEYGPFGEAIKAVGTAATLNPFTFSTKFVDAESNLSYYGFRYYCPSTGRWLSRDPIEEAGGGNLYGVVGNDPIDRIDLHGLWGSGDHAQMTRGAWASANLPSEMQPYANQMADVLVQQNAWVDDKWMSQNRWHFNRGLDEDIDTAIRAYTDNIFTQREDIRSRLATPSAQNCRRALEIMGNLSHAFQDYYAHAVLRTITSANPHRTSATDPHTTSSTTSLAGNFDESVGYVTGNPNSPGTNMKPSSFPNHYIWYFVTGQGLGEHGGSEPGDRAPDRESRRQQAREFTTGEFRTFATDWWRACKCHANEISSH